MCTILIFLVAVKVAFSRVFLVSEKGLGDLVPNYLFVFVAYCEFYYYLKLEYLICMHLIFLRSPELFETARFRRV